MLTPDGRRVMGAWLATIHPDVNLKTVQSLPRELSLHEDGCLRIEPLQELTSLRYDRVAYKDIVYTVNLSPETDILDDNNPWTFPDIRTGCYEDFFLKVRAEFKKAKSLV